MGTVIRSEVSKNNEYYISKHRYYELKHYCLQYNLWRRALAIMNLYPGKSEGIVQGNTSDPTNNLAEKRSQYLDKIEMLDKVAKDTDPVIGPCVLKGIITGMSYDALKTQIDIPCCKDSYYTIYRKFFWLLDKVRK